MLRGLSRHTATWLPPTREPSERESIGQARFSWRSVATVTLTAETRDGRLSCHSCSLHRIVLATIYVDIITCCFTNNTTDLSRRDSLNVVWDDILWDFIRKNSAEETRKFSTLPFVFNFRSCRNVLETAWARFPRSTCSPKNITH